MPTPPVTPRPSRRAALSAAAIALLVLAGCGGGKGSETTDTTGAAADTSTTVADAGATSTTAAAAGGAPSTVAGGTPGSVGAAGGVTNTTVKRTTTTLKPTAAAADVSKAKGYLITAGDLPDYTKEDGGGGGDEAGTSLEKCGKGNPVYANSNPNRFSGDLLRKGVSFADAALVGSVSTVTKSAAEASEAMAIAKTDEFLRCVEEQAKEQGAKRAPQGTTFEAKAERRPYSAGDDAVLIHVTVTGTYGAQRFTGDVDSFGVRKGADVVLGIVTVIGPSNAGEPARIGEILKKKTG